jgi:O-antigen ligase
VGVLLSGQLLARARPAATLAETRSLNERGRLIGIALDLVAERPLTGIGAGNFALAMFEVETSMHPQPVHNVPLLLAAEVGALGALVWFWLWLAPGLALSHLRRDQNHWLVVLVAALFGLGIISLWDDYPWALNAGRLLSVTLLGLTGPALEVQ